MIRTILEYASPEFLYPGSGFHAKILSMCKRAFRIVHGGGVRSCNECDMFNFVERRKSFSMRLFSEALLDSNHVIHNLIPERSIRSCRIILPSIRTERRANGFIFGCFILHNE